MKIEHCDYSDVIRQELEKLEELTFGKRSYKGVDGKTYFHRTGHGAAAYPGDVLRDYLSITPKDETTLEAVFDTSKMTIMLDYDVKRENILGKMVSALRRVGLADSTLINQKVPESLAEDAGFASRPKLEIRLPNTMQTVQELGRANKALLFEKAKVAYDEKHDIDAAHAVIQEYASKHATEHLLDEFDASIGFSPRKGIA